MKISAKTKTKKKRGARASHVVTSPSIEPVHGWFGLTYANYLVLPRGPALSACAEVVRGGHGALK